MYNRLEDNIIWIHTYIHTYVHTYEMCCNQLQVAITMILLCTPNDVILSMLMSPCMQCINSLQLHELYGKHLTMNHVVTMEETGHNVEFVPHRFPLHTHTAHADFLTIKCCGSLHFTEVP